MRLGQLAPYHRAVDAHQHQRKMRSSPELPRFLFNHGIAAVWSSLSNPPSPLETQGTRVFPDPHFHYRRSEGVPCDHTALRGHLLQGPRPWCWRRRRRSHPIATKPYAAASRNGRPCPCAAGREKPKAKQTRCQTGQCSPRASWMGVLVVGFTTRTENRHLQRKQLRHIQLATLCSVMLMWADVPQFLIRNRSK